jgi:hypothetical protein
VISCVLLAINHGGVVVAKEYVVDVEEITFDDTLRLFRAKHHGTFITFFNERELNFHLDEIRRRRHT